MNFKFLTLLLFIIGQSYACEDWWVLDIKNESLKRFHKCNPGIEHKIEITGDFKIKNIEKLLSDSDRCDRIIFAENISPVNPQHNNRIIKDLRGFIKYQENELGLFICLYLRKNDEDIYSESIWNGKWNLKILK